MSKLKWFSGSKERRDNALDLLESIIIEIREIEGSESLQEFLLTYKDELEKQKAPIPTILSRFNVELSGVLRDSNIILTDRVKEALNSIRKLSYIRYGYY
ncbi:bacteriocin immunity protein [Streptococcus downei]|uniref:Putative bacteriocin immunity protein n=1 Tax=Streptococcus downei MFe28 TaxID=764290 RepID=A0A380JEF5_STRDO|nr:bacteriocin immunity protein [Streptococcus downei]SUN36244.1 putative bacteriocin immunity protein [Streptococcus downei MFe28]